MKLRSRTGLPSVGIYTRFLVEASGPIWQPSAVAPDASGRLGDDKEDELGRTDWLPRAPPGRSAAAAHFSKADIVSAVSLRPPREERVVRVDWTNARRTAPIVLKKSA